MADPAVGEAAVLPVGCALADPVPAPALDGALLTAPLALHAATAATQAAATATAHASARGRRRLL